MTRRIAEQWRELTLQDQQRRELFANISHDLRTPLTSLHGYLETLLLKAGTLERRGTPALPGDRAGPEPQGRPAGAGGVRAGAARTRRGQAREGKLLAADLVQDVFQKFELAAEARPAA
jgi:signal transduction histidine kinase